MVTTQIHYLGHLRTEAEHVRSGSRLITDAPIDNQGRGECFSPTDLLATALGSCMLTIIGIAARAHGFSVEGARVAVTKVMGTAPRRVVEVIVDFSFPPAGYTAGEQRIIEQAARDCPVARSLHPDLKQTLRFHF